MISLLQAPKSNLPSENEFVQSTRRVSGFPPQPPSSRIMQPDLLPGSAMTTQRSEHRKGSKSCLIVEDGCITTSIVPSEPPRRSAHSRGLVQPQAPSYGQSSYQMSPRSSMSYGRAHTQDGMGEYHQASSNVHGRDRDAVSASYAHTYAGRNVLGQVDLHGNNRSSTLVHAPPGGRSQITLC